MSNNAVTPAASSEAVLGLAGAFRDCIGCAWVAIDERRRIVSFSPEAGDLMGLSARQLRNQPFSVLPEPIQRAIQATFSTGKAIRSRRIMLPASDAGKITIRLSTIAVRAAKRKCAAVLVTMSDQGSVERLEQTTQRLQRLASIGMLSTSLAHEIKNALVAVKTFIDLLLEKNRDAELAEIVGRELRRVDGIVSQMLKFAGPAKPGLGATAVHELLDQSLHMIHRQLEGKLITLHRAYAAAPDLVKGNGHQLQQALVNLFLNAADAMGPNGELSVATELVATDTSGSKRARARNLPHVRITIKDTGVGVAPENMDRLFEPFFTTKKNGTGLGLAITRRIIQEHHGSITVESQANQGTAFNILLPALNQAIDGRDGNPVTAGREVARE